MSLIRQQFKRHAPLLLKRRRFCHLPRSRLASSTQDNSNSARPRRPPPLSAGAQAAEWYQSLEKYVTNNLKLPPDEPSEENGIARRKSLLGLLHILETARRQGNIDLLAYISTSVQRWLDMDSAIGQLLEYSKDHDVRRDDYRSLPYWADQIYGDARPLDEATRTPIEPEKLHSNYLRCLSSPSFSRSTLEHRILSEVWQSLGTMIVAAESDSSDSRTQRTIMAFFVDLVAQLHHHNAMPRTIYDYSSPSELGIFRRPPLLHCLSPRVMAQLSNASWTKQWLVDMVEHEEQGFKLPPPRPQPLLKPLENATWLDFILWSCIEGGWIHEASMIVSQIAPPSSQAWVVISWENLCKGSLPPHFTKAQWLDFRTDRLQPSEMKDMGLIDMNRRTISREVILTILDYMVMDAKHTARSKTFSIENAIQYFQQTQSILRRSDEDLDVSTWNALVFRLLDTAAVTFHNDPNQVESIVSLSPVLENARQPNESVQAAFENNDLDLSAWVLGLEHRNLGSFARRSNESGLLRSLEGIVNITDANRNLYIREFARELRTMAVGESHLDDHRPKHSPLLHPQIPLPVLADLLEFLSENKVEDLGDFLFDRNALDGGFIQSQDYGRAGLQPKLIQYAISRESQDILTRVVEQLVSPIPTKVVHALLRYRVATHQWPEVVDILRQLSLSREVHWNAEDAMVIAAYAVRLHNSNDGGDVRKAEHAKRVLVDMLRGLYDPMKDASDVADLGQVKLSNQIKRILQSVPNKFFGFLSDVKVRQQGGRSSPARISPYAFQQILETVVERHGPVAGQHFLDDWCQDPSVPLSNDGPIVDYTKRTEKVVKLTPLLIGTIIKPITKRLNQKLVELDEAQWQNWEQIESLIGTISQRELLLLRWAIKTYRALRIEASGFEKIFPGAHNLLATGDVSN